MASIDTRLFVGVDPCGGQYPFTWAALDANGRLLTLQAGEMEGALAFLESQPQVLAAVNAAPRPSQGLVHQELIPLRRSGRGQEMRLAEHLLRQRGINVALTPSHRGLSPAWVQLGFEFHHRLEGLGFKSYWDSEIKQTWIETQAHAVFCALLERAPLPRPTLEGRLQRQLILYEQGLAIRDPMEYFEELTRHRLLKGILPPEQVYTPEELDAIAAACTAWLLSRHPEQACRLGDPNEGQITLPVAELKIKY